MGDKVIVGVCPTCGKEMLIIATQFRDYTNWQIKYGIECENCGYRFKVDKKSLDDLLRLSKNKEKS
jgi:DNA-directed RNA polymerase subunit RPC12/RpoP